jgi:rhodanese-related sulfurtransferase
MMVIDVRSKEEYERSHIKGAKWFDVERIIHGEMPIAKKDEEIILYCRTGARSTAAMYKMRAAGFHNTRNGGGLADMAANGYPVEY